MRRILGCLVAIAVACAATVRKHGTDVLSVRMVQAFAAASVLVALSAFGLYSSTATTGVLAFAVLMGDTARADIASMVADEVVETFKEVYLDAQNAIPDAMPLTAQMKKTTKVQGAATDLTFNVKLRTGGAVANVGDGQKMPRPSRGMRKKGKAGLAHTYTVIAVGGQSIPLTKGNRNAFVSNLEEQFEDGMERVKFDLERQYNGDGKGILCILETVIGAPEYGAERPFGYTYAQAGVDGVQLLVEDMDVACVDPATGDERSRATITEIDWDNDTFTTDVALTDAEIGDFIVLCNDKNLDGAGGDEDASINYLNEANGIGAVTDSAADSFEDIDADISRRWQPVDKDLNDNVISEKEWATLDQRIIARSGQKPEIYYTTRGIVVEMQDQLSDRIRYQGEKLQLRGGYTALMMNGRPVLPGDWCPKGHLYALNFAKKNVATVDVVKMGYVDLDGSKLHRIEGRHSYRGDLWFPHNAIWFLRAAQGRLTGITDNLDIQR